MSTKIEPYAVEQVEGNTVNRYELPEDKETAFWVDTSTDSYSVTWEVSDEFRVEDYVEFLLGFDESQFDCLAAFDDRDDRIESDLSGVIDEPGYPSRCTYLRTEAESFDIEWIEGSYSNRLVFSSSPQNEQLFRNVFHGIKNIYGEPSFDLSYSEGLEQVERVVSRDGGEDIERELEI